MGLPKQQLAVLVQADGSAVLGSTEVPECGRDEVVVKIEAAAQNPSDCMRACLIALSFTNMSFLGMVAQMNTTPGAILGFDFAGTIEQLGSDISTQKAHIGQRVSGFVLGGGRFQYISQLSSD